MITLTSGIKPTKEPTVTTKELGDQRVGTYVLLSGFPLGERTIQEFEADKSAYTKVVILEHNYQSKLVRVLKFSHTLDDDIAVSFSSSTPCYPLKCVKLELEANFVY